MRFPSPVVDIGVPSDHDRNDDNHMTILGMGAKAQYPWKTGAFFAGTMGYDMSKTSHPSRLTCFKAYDIRGQIGVDLDASVVRDIALAFVQVMTPKTVVLGHDCRHTSPEFHKALSDGLVSLGVDVIDIGLAGTEEVYFATDHYRACGGIEVTASHNPADYNGMKLVGPGSRPLTPQEFDEVAMLASTRPSAKAKVSTPGTVSKQDPRPAYAAHVINLVNKAEIGNLKLVVNAGNGVAGPAFDAILDALGDAANSLDVVRINHTPDSRFPKGIPNPLLVENRQETADAVRRLKADLGIAWDGDFDRCFFFDHTGAFVEGEYVVGLLASAFLTDTPGETIVHDPRVIWSTTHQIKRHGGTAATSKTGHAHVKQAMRDTGAIYGGEMSAHHYFRDFMSCDSGMIPWLKLIEYLGRTEQTLAGLVAEMKADFPSSGERNFVVSDAKACMKKVFTAYEATANNINRLDGLSMSFDTWHMNLRMSSTEPLLRLNVETNKDGPAIETLVSEIVQLIEKNADTTT